MALIEKLEQGTKLVLIFLSIFLILIQIVTLFRNKKRSEQSLLFIFIDKPLAQPHDFLILGRRFEYRRNYDSALHNPVL
jgi:hypothetical protein